VTNRVGVGPGREGEGQGVRVRVTVRHSASHQTLCEKVVDLPDTAANPTVFCPPPPPSPYSAVQEVP
jgi:hypothetical protein